MEARKTVTLRVGNLAKYSVIVVVIIALWFAPLFTNFRYEYTAYDQQVILKPSAYAERKIVVYLPEERDCVLSGGFFVIGGRDVIQVSVMDLPNYDNWRTGQSYSVLYVSDVSSGASFNMPLAQKNQGETEYYIVLTSFSDETTISEFTAKINYERIFRGYTYPFWISRIGIVVCFVIIILMLLASKYQIQLALE